LPFYLDELARMFGLISISAGMRGLQVLLAPDDYIRAVDAKIDPIAKYKD
jgi:Cys-tRNA(Pro)/Cys-tRNA(Cys) deacylase